MADIESASWSETDASNNSASPNGWASGSMLPSQVEPTARGMMGALKRDWDHKGPTLTSGGAANVQTLTYSVAPTAYVQGQIFTFIAGFTNSGAATLNVNALGAKAVQASGAALVGGEITAAKIVSVAYDGTQFQIISTGGVRGIAQGGTGQSVAPLFSTSSPTSGGAITAASQVMFALNTAFTPATTGKMKLTVTGTLTMGATAQAYTLQLRSAAGTPPTFGAAASGTVLSAATWSAVANSQAIQFSLTGIITLTAGVAAWVDVSALTSGGASASITSNTAIIDEKPV